MAKQILHGIGKVVLKDFRNPKKVIGFTDLTDFTIDSAATTEDIVGGNKMFPIATFKTDSTVTASGTNATFSSGLIEYLEGAEAEVGVKAMTGILEVAIPEELEITLPKTPVADSIVVTGMEVGTAEAAGKYTLTGEVLKFNAADVGKKVVIVYSYNTSATAVEYAVTQKSLTKPFILEYITDIYDEDAQVSHELMIKLYKAKSTTGFSIGGSHKAPYAQTFEAKAQDPARVDGKLWTMLIDGIEF